jgi:hypothetical protein
MASAITVWRLHASTKAGYDTRTLAMPLHKVSSSVIGATSLAALEVAISASVESLEAANAAAIESRAISTAGSATEAAGKGLALSWAASEKKAGHVFKRNTAGNDYFGIFVFIFRDTFQHSVRSGFALVSCGCVSFCGS